MNRIAKIPVLLFSLALACNFSTNTVPAAGARKAEPKGQDASIAHLPCRPDTFSRDSILRNLRAKITRKEFLVVHVFVPLCDNEHQGIVPVNKQLGDGLNLRTNLYWGAGYGVKSFLKADKSWKLLSTRADYSPDVLERVIFEKKHTGGAHLLLVADAYRGDRMKACITDFLSTLAGQQTDSLFLDSLKLFTGTPDLAIFNGHNGLMDMEVEAIGQTTPQLKDAAVIACASRPYFTNSLRCAGAFPLVMTRHLLAPEAYVMAAVVEGWSRLEQEGQVRTRAAQAYADYQKCGFKGASGIFYSGW